MATTIVQFCKACNGQHDYYLPETIDAAAPSSLEYTCPKTTRRMILDGSPDWDGLTQRVDESSVIVRQVPR